MDYKKIYDQNYFNGKNSFFHGLGYGRFARFYFSNLFKPLKSHIREIEAGKVLDVGCAYGFMLKRFPKTFEKFGVDISDWVIKEGKKRLPGAVFEIADAEEKLPFPGEFFDVVICNDVLEHFKNPALALKNIGKTLKKEGILYITTPNSNWLRKKLFKRADKKEHHISLFSQEDFLNLLAKSGFEVVDHWTYIGLAYLFFPKFKSGLGVESAFICRKSIE